MDPNSYQAYNGRAIAKAELGHSEAAIADFDEAIHKNPDYTEAYFNRGISKIELEHEVVAAQDFQKALSLAQETGDEKLIAIIKKQM